MFEKLQLEDNSWFPLFRATTICEKKTNDIEEEMIIDQLSQLQKKMNLLSQKFEN